jgi:hypothetical protein
MSGADEVSGEVVITKSLSYMLLLLVPEHVRDCLTFFHTACIYCFSILVYPLFVVPSSHF